MTLSIHFFSYSAAEVTVILANVSKYLTYVRSSVSYVQKHLNSVREPLEFVQVNILLNTCSAYEDVQRISYFVADHYNYGEEKSLRHVAMVAKFLDDNKPKRHRLKKWIRTVSNSLRKHPLLLALRRRGRFARRNVCDSAAEIPYWWRKPMFTS